MTEQHKLRWSFSSLGCPDHSLDEILDLAERYYFDAVELRCLNGSTDLVKRLSEYASKDMSRFKSSPVEIVALNSSFGLIGAIQSDLEELFKLAILADIFGCKYIRIFHGLKWGDKCQAIDYLHAANSVNCWKEWKKSHGIKAEIALETHTAASSSQNCLDLFNKIGHALPVIWDSHHTFVYAGEAPAYTWQQMQEYIVHVHVKDSIMVPSARHDYTYTLPGHGHIPTDEVINLLAENNFKGIVSLEWEKQWHPYLTNLEEAFEHLNTSGWRKES
jgi:sugar phosphate isomerase/epimerase